MHSMSSFHKSLMNVMKLENNWRFLGEQGETPRTYFSPSSSL